MSRHLLWILVLIAFGSSFAVQAESRCQRKAVKKKAEFIAKMDQVEESFKVVQTSIIDNGLQQFQQQDIRQKVKEAVDGLIADARLPEKRTVWSAPVKVFLDTTIEKGKASGNCSSFGSLHDSSVHARKEYEKHHESLMETLERRLSLADLAPDEGYAIVVAASSGYAERFYLGRRGALNADFQFGPLVSEDFFQVVKVKAGTYYWNKVKVSGGHRRYYYFKLYEMIDQDVEIEAGKLNYIGVMSFQRSLQSAKAVVHDRATVVMKMFELRYPELIGKFPVANGLTGDDSFLEFFSSESEVEDAP